MEAQQTMGRIILTYPLQFEHAELRVDDVEVRMTHSEIRVTIPGARGRVDFAPVSGPLCARIRRYLSSWDISDEDGERSLVFHLVKENHSSWSQIWEKGTRIWRRAQSFAWRRDQQALIDKQFKDYENELEVVEPGHVSRLTSHDLLGES